MKNPSFLKGILAPVNRYYTEKIRLHGTTSLGVDWKTPQSQELRFRQLISLLDPRISFSVNDFGCGYGSLFAFLQDRKFHFQYHGFDISSLMIEKALKNYGRRANAHFRVAYSPDKPRDYSLASGIFNVRLKASSASWKKYILSVIEKMNRFSRKGFAFNCLTSYSDKERMREDLYYSDPCFLFDYCKRHFSKNVALLHDYGLYEFTVLVRKDV